MRVTPLPVLGPFISRQPHFQIKLKEEELAQFLILRLYEKRDKSL